MQAKLPVTERTKVKRKPDRAHYEKAAIFAALDNAFFATIAFFDGSAVHAIPTAIWRESDYLYVHGSRGSRLIQFLQTGAPVCVSTTQMNGLVLARSALHHSMNYDSVCIYGNFEQTIEENKTQHMQYFMEHWMPGRWQYVRPPSENELAALTILRISITEAVLKSRQGPPMDKAEDVDRAVWAGVIPLQLQWQTAQQVSEQKETDFLGKSVRNLR